MLSKIVTFWAAGHRQESQNHKVHKLSLNNTEGKTLFLASLTEWHGS